MYNFKEAYHLEAEDSAKSNSVPMSITCMFAILRE